MSEYKNAVDDFQRFKNAGYCYFELPSSGNIELAIKALGELANFEGGECVQCQAGFYLEVLGYIRKDNYCPMCGRSLKQKDEEAEYWISQGKGC